jgi:hypothetical protein
MNEVAYSAHNRLTELEQKLGKFDAAGGATLTDADEDMVARVVARALDAVFERLEVLEGGGQTDARILLPLENRLKKLEQLVLSVVVDDPEEEE